MNANVADPSAALRAAVCANDAAAVLDLLQGGAAPLVAEAETGATALHLAAARGHAETVEALIQAGCDVGVQDYVRKNCFPFSFLSFFTLWRSA